MFVPAKDCEVEMIEVLLAALVSGLLMIYLVYALIKPEKF